MKPNPLTEEQEQKVKDKVTQLLNEKKYREAAELIVALVVSKMDPEEFARELIRKVQEYKAVTP